MSPTKKKLRSLSPNQALILYYAVSIFTGALLLSLPVAAIGRPVAFLDALFTATSAQCVTGLSVIDVGARLSLFGQLVLLALIQLGGLGVTTFSVYLFFYLRKGVSTRGRWIIHDTLLHTPVESLRDLVRGIFLLTIAIEGVGALLLAVAFIPDLGWGRGIYYAIFHSISAFCNAGFALFSDSLIGYRANGLVNFTIIMLIVLGGIGFLVMRELIDVGRAWRRPGRRQRLSLHTKLVLWTTGALIVGGTVLILILESHAALRGMPWTERFWISLFQSVTARTAGFNTIDLNRFAVPTIFLIMFLMFIGASPGSAGGGIKTTSLALFVAILHSRLKGVSHTNVFRRTVPDEIITKTLTLVMLAALLIGAASFALLAVQLQGHSFAQSRGAFMDYTFEAVSAFATAGLSLGATAKLTAWGKLIIIALMYVGRVGLLTLAFTIVGRAKAHPVQYGEENIMIG